MTNFELLSFYNMTTCLFVIVSCYQSIGKTYIYTVVKNPPEGFLTFTDFRQDGEEYYNSLLSIMLRLKL